VLNRSYDERGNVLQETRGGSVTTYRYDAANRVSSISYPSGSNVRYARDQMGRVTGVTGQVYGGATGPIVSGIASIVPG